MLERVKKIKPQFEDDTIEEVILTVKDRIAIRLYPLAVDTFPTELESVVVSIAKAELNRAEHDNEGVKSESIGGWNISFIDDMLSVFEDDINLYKKHHMKEEGLVDEETDDGRPSGLRWF